MLRKWIVLASAVGLIAGVGACKNNPNGATQGTDNTSSTSPQGRRGDTLRRDTTPTPSSPGSTPTAPSATPSSPSGSSSDTSSSSTPSSSGSSSATPSNSGSPGTSGSSSSSSGTSGSNR